MRNKPHTPKEPAYFGAAIGLAGVFIIIIGCILSILYQLINF